MEIITRIDAAKRGLKRLLHPEKRVSTDMTVNAGFTTDTVLSAPWNQTVVSIAEIQQNHD